MASDVFSLGIVLHEMLTGRKAFSGSNVLQLLEQIRHLDPARHASDVPERFAEILRGALACEPRERVLTMKRIAEMLG